MSDSILTLLNSDKPAQRKKGIGAAAKTADTRYLKQLALIYKTDPDPALRELAKKAGLYINKHQQEPVPAAPIQQPPAATDADDDLMALRDQVLANLPAEDEQEPEVTAPPTAREVAAAAPLAPTLEDMLPGGGGATAAQLDPEQAEFHYNTAFELHMKGNNARAALELGTAFHLHPDYANDPTAVSFAAEMTGKPPADAAAYIANPANWEAITELHGGITPGSAERGWVLQLSGWVLGVVALGIVLMLVVGFVQGDLFSAALGDVMESLFGGIVGENSVFNEGG